MNMIKVSVNSRTSALAGAIAGVQAIAAGAVNQAMKALALAAGYLKGDGINITACPNLWT